MKVEYNENNNTIKIVDISANQASTIALALKNPLAAAAVGAEFINDFNKYKDKAHNIQQNKKG